MSEHIEDLLNMSIEDLRGCIEKLNSMIEWLYSKNCKLMSIIDPITTELAEYEYMLQIKQTQE